jgi:hypothetical protein
MQNSFVSRILHIFFPNLFQNHPVFRIPTWIPDLIFKYQDTMNTLENVFWVAFLPGQARHLT